MLKQVIKLGVVLAGSTVVIPYAVAILANMLYGWPQKNNRTNFRRALSPRKVYALNYAILLQLTKLKYLKLRHKWRKFYSEATSKQVIKDIDYGSHDNRLDLYFPLSRAGDRLEGTHPVVVFVYGGTWSSGDKSMYSLLCAQLAEQLQAVVCCPNYSLYPKGYVDDMVQDVVNCLEWIQNNAHLQQIDKTRVMLVGHSAGAHLCLLSVLELIRKRLLHDPHSLIMSQQEVDLVASQQLNRHSSIFTQSLQFDEGHFHSSESDEDGDNRLEATSGSASSGNSPFVFIKGKEFGPSSASMEVQHGSESFFMVGEGSNGSGDEAGDEAEKEKEDEDGEAERGESDSPPISMQLDAEAQKALSTADEEERARSLTPQIIVSEEGRDPESVDSLTSIRLIIGLAGVYDIADHFEFESWRGVEDISSMARAMYGPRNFERLSPTQILKQLPLNTRVPPILLIHGDSDNTVPESSSLKCGKALWELGSRCVQYLVIPRCGHLDICLDLMDPEREWYTPVMAEIIKAAKFNL